LISLIPRQFAEICIVPLSSLIAGYSIVSKLTQQNDSDPTRQYQLSKLSDLPSPDPSCDCSPRQQP